MLSFALAVIATVPRLLIILLFKGEVMEIVGAIASGIRVGVGVDEGPLGVGELVIGVILGLTDVTVETAFAALIRPNCQYVPVPAIASAVCWI